MNTLKTTTLTALVLAAGLTLITACSNTPETVETSEPTATVETQTPETPEVTAPAAGDTLTAEQAEALPEGFKAYALADGTVVAVAANEPLPAAVAADVTAKADAEFVPGAEGGGASLGGTRSAAQTASMDTGKKVLIVAQAFAWPPDAPLDDMGPGLLLWFVAGVTIISDGDGFTKDEAVAAAQAYVAAQPNPENFEIIVQSY